jgi:hypothetical protein
MLDLTSSETLALNQLAAEGLFCKGRLELQDYESSVLTQGNA